MTVLDLGCGPGFFTLEAAKLTGETGRVIAADLQEKMLEIVDRKIKGTPVEKVLKLHKCDADKIGLTEKVDFVLAFWMIHEVPDKQRLFRELSLLLKPGGRMFIIEPKFHVTGKEFREMEKILDAIGFEIIERPSVSISRAILIRLKD
jgi:ubiquinone/menaquinone biosynthesis C-methylase UbiE